MAHPPRSGRAYGPERDRALAARPRGAYRAPCELGSELGFLRGSPAYAAMRRFAKVHGALEAALPEHARGKVRALTIRDGACTLAVADGVLCAELRGTCARRILAALAAAGTGVTRLAWRVARRS